MADSTPNFADALHAPDAPRALLVSLDCDGRLSHLSTFHGQSVLNIEADLPGHLGAQPLSDEWLAGLRDYAQARPCARAEARQTGGVSIQRNGAFVIAHVEAFQSLRFKGAPNV